VNQPLAGFTNAQQVALQAQYGSCAAFAADVSLVGDGVSAVGDSVSKGDDTVYVVTQAVSAVQQDISAVQDLKSKLVAAGGQPAVTIDSLLTQANHQQAAASTAVTSADQQMKALYQKANDLTTPSKTPVTTACASHSPHPEGIDPHRSWHPRHTGATVIAVAVAFPRTFSERPRILTAGACCVFSGPIRSGMTT
jgi:hypothetical protein